MGLISWKIFIAYLSVCYCQEVDVSNNLPVFSQCGGTTSALQGIVTSPGYPQTYDNGLSCLWTIETPAETFVEVTLVDVNLTMTPRCAKDYLTVMFSGDSHLKYRTCYPPTENNVLTGRGPAQFFFQTSYSFHVADYSRRGFFVTYKVDSPCLPEPCKNGATCQYTSTASPYTCLCRPGYTGRDCDVEINECDEVTCENTGVCVDLLNDFRCDCIPGTSGRMCEVLDNPCIFDPCKNSGTCVSSGDQSYTCNCLPGYEGLNCEAEKNECLSIPCMNGGTCTDLFNNFTCDCRIGFDGRNCQIVLETTATTTTPVPTPVQPTEPEATSNGQIPENKCADEGYCLNGGTCAVVASSNTVTCICTDQYEGDNCEITKPDDGVSLFRTVMIAALAGLILVLLLLILTCFYFIKKRRKDKAKVWSAVTYNDKNRFVSRQTQNTSVGSLSMKEKSVLTPQSSIDVCDISNKSSPVPNYIDPDVALIPVVVNSNGSALNKGELNRSSSHPFRPSDNSFPNGNQVIPPHTTPLPRKEFVPPPPNYMNLSQELKPKPRQTWGPLTRTGVKAEPMYETIPPNQRHTTACHPEYMEYNPHFDKADGRPPLPRQLFRENHLPSNLGNGSISHNTVPQVGMLPGQPSPNDNGIKTISSVASRPSSLKKSVNTPSPSPKNRIPNGLAERLLRQMHKQSPMNGISPKNIPRRKDKTKHKVKSASTSLNNDVSPSKGLRENLRRSEPHLQGSIRTFEAELKQRNKSQGAIQTKRNGAVVAFENEKNPLEKEKAFMLEAR